MRKVLLFYEAVKNIKNTPTTYLQIKIVNSSLAYLNLI